MNVMRIFHFLIICRMKPLMTVILILYCSAEGDNRLGRYFENENKTKFWFFFKAATLKPYLVAVKRTLEAAMCLENFSSQKVVNILTA